jgi:outer membrane immunogenic protein
MGPTLLYATGGLAFADLAGTYYVGAGPRQEFRSTEAGWTVGAGLEYAVAPNWTTRIEYRYTDYGQLTDTPSAAVVPGGFGYRNNVDFHTVRLGLSYKFGGGGPVVASY